MGVSLATCPLARYDHPIMTKHVRALLFRFALIAFLFSAVVPFFAVYDLPGSPAEQERLAQLFGEKILICSEKGFEWVRLADIGQGEHQPKPDSHLKCALCYVASKGAAHHPLSSVALDMPRGRVLRLHSPLVDTATGRLSERPANPRAPPAFV